MHVDQEYLSRAPKRKNIIGTGREADCVQQLLCLLADLLFLPNVSSNSALNRGAQFIVLWGRQQSRLFSFHNWIKLFFGKKVIELWTLKIWF